MYNMYLRFLENTSFLEYVVLMVCIAIMFLWAVHQTYIQWKAKLPKETLRKFKALCKLENRQPTDQIHYIIKHFIQDYEEKNDIRL